MRIYIAEELFPFGDHDWITIGYHRTIEGAANRLNIPYTEENFPPVYKYHDVYGKFQEGYRIRVEILNED